MKKLVVLIAVTLILCFVSACAGYVYGGSNLPLSSYPEFYSYKPHPPFGKNSYEADNYRIEVESYVRKAENYIDDAINDIERIQYEIEEARNSANRVVREYNNWVQFGY